MLPGLGGGEGTSPWLTKAGPGGSRVGQEASPPCEPWGSSGCAGGRGGGGGARGPGLPRDSAFASPTSSEMSKTQKSPKTGPPDAVFTPRRLRAWGGGLWASWEGGGLRVSGGLSSPGVGGSEPLFTRQGQRAEGLWAPPGPAHTRCTDTDVHSPRAVPCAQWRCGSVAPRPSVTTRGRGCEGPGRTSKGISEGPTLVIRDEGEMGEQRPAFWAPASLMPSPRPPQGPSVRPSLPTQKDRGL